MRSLSLVVTVAAVCLAIGFVAGGAAEAPGPRHLNAPGASADLPFSHAVLAGETLYLAGGIGIDPATGRAPEDVEREIRLMLDGMKAKLALAGMSMDDLVSVQVFCSDISLYDKFNAIYRTYFEKAFPARAFIGVGTILRGGRFEIQGIAWKKGAGA